MKSILVLCVTLMTGISGFSQIRSVEQLFEKYSGKEGFTSVSITKSMFDLFSQMETAPDDDYMNAIKNLTGIKILSTEKSIDGINFYKDVAPLIQSKYYEELMSIQESNQEIKFLTRKKEGKVVELLMVVGGKQENVLIWITGVIDMKTIGKIASNMNIQGMEKLEKIEK